MRKTHKQALANKDLQGIWLYSFKNWGEKQADKYFDEIVRILHDSMNFKTHF